MEKSNNGTFFSLCVALVFPRICWSALGSSSALAWLGTFFGEVVSSTPESMESSEVRVFSFSSIYCTSLRFSWVTAFGDSGALIIIGLSNAPQTTMFSCSRPTKSRLYLQPICSFRAVITWRGGSKQENSRLVLHSRLQYPEKHLHAHLVTSFVNNYSTLQMLSFQTIF